MKNVFSLRNLACALAAALTATTALAQSPVIYPAKGQSPKQQDVDRYQCHDWARSQSGFDPTTAQPPPNQQPSASTTAASSSKDSATGMVKGAARGAAVAELSHHDAGRGAAIGVLGSGVMERVKQQKAAQAQAGQQQAAAAQAAAGQQRMAYSRGFAACMEGRGYVVK